MRPIGLSHPVGKASDAMARAFSHCSKELVGGLAVALDIVPPELRQLVLLWITGAQYHVRGFTQFFEEPLVTRVSDKPLNEWGSCSKSWPRFLRVSALWKQRFLPVCRVTAARATYGRLHSSGLTNNGLQKELLDRLGVCEPGAHILHNMTGRHREMAATTSG